MTQSANSNEKKRLFFIFIMEPLAVFPPGMAPATVAPVAGVNTEA